MCTRRVTAYCREAFAITARTLMTSTFPGPILCNVETFAVEVQDGSTVRERRQLLDSSTRARLEFCVLTGADILDWDRLADAGQDDALVAFGNQRKAGVP